MLLEIAAGERLLAGDLVSGPGEFTSKKKPRGIISGLSGDIGGVVIRVAS